MSHTEGIAHIELSLETFLSDKDAKAVMKFIDEKIKLRQERDELAKALRDVAENRPMRPNRYREIKAMLAKYQEQS